MQLGKKCATKLKVINRSFTGGRIGEKGKGVEANNARASYHQEKTNVLRDKLSELMENNDNGENMEEIKQLTDEINELSLHNTPAWQFLLNLHINEQTIKLDYFEPISLKNIYKKLSGTSGAFVGGEGV